MSMKEQIVDDLHAIKVTYLCHVALIYVACIAANYFCIQSNNIILGLPTGIISALLGLKIDKIHNNINQYQADLMEIYNRIDD